MPDYKKMYHIMRDAALYSSARAENIAETVFKALRECEELYMDSDEPPIELHNSSKSEPAEE